MRQTVCSIGIVFARRIRSPASVKATYFILLSLALVLPACDLDIDPDPPKADLSEVPEPSRRRGNEPLLLSRKAPLERGTRMEDSRKLTMKHMGFTVEVGEEIALTGAADLSFTEERSVTVQSSSIWTIDTGDIGLEMKLSPRGQEAQVMTLPHPLANQVLNCDGPRVSMEAMPNDDQREEMKSYQVEWFGGNELFSKDEVKTRGEWVVKPEDILGAIFGEVFENGSGSAHLFVEKTLNYDDRRTAEVVVSLERCRGTTIDQDGKPMEIELHGYGKLFRCLEPQHTTQVDIKGDAKITITEPDSVMKFTGPFELLAKSDLTTSL